MGRIRGDVCRGLFRSATNLDAFKHMLSRLQKQAQTVGPDDAAVAKTAGGIGAPVASGQAGEGTKKRQLPKVKVEQVRRELPKIGRNEIVTIRKGPETQQVKFKNGIETPVAKKITKAIKDAKMKVQTQIQGEQVRVTGKKRDDLQAVIQLVKDSDFEQPFQFENFRD